MSIDNKKHKPVLAMDFDGVIWDSVRECFYVASECWNSMESVPQSCSYAEFAAGRWLVRDGGQFGIILSILNKSKVDLAKYTQDKFAQDCAANKNWADEFSAKFAALRSNLRENNFAFWYGLQNPYPNILQVLNELRPKVHSVTICTTKDELSAGKLLQGSGLNIPILGKNFSLSKAKQLEHLIKICGCRAQDVYFTDDLLINLLEVAHLGVNLIMAGWGYNTEQTCDKARKMGIFVARDPKEMSKYIKSNY